MEKKPLPDYWKFRQRLKECRAKSELNLNQFAIHLGVSRSVAEKWETGAIPKADTLAKIADTFNVSTDYLIGRTDIPEIRKGGNVMQVLKHFTGDDVVFLWKMLNIRYLEVEERMQNQKGVDE